MTLERWYHRTAIVLWPRGKQHGWANFEAELTSVIEPDYTEGDATCRVAVGRVINAAGVHCARREQPELVQDLCGRQFERVDG